MMRSSEPTIGTSSTFCPRAARRFRHHSARVIRMPHAFARRRLASFNSSVPGLSIVTAAHMGGGRHHLERTAALAIDAFPDPLRRANLLISPMHFMARDRPALFRCGHR